MIKLVDSYNFARRWNGLKPDEIPQGAELDKVFSKWTVRSGSRGNPNSWTTSTAELLGVRTMTTNRYGLKSHGLYCWKGLAFWVDHRFVHLNGNSTFDDLFLRKRDYSRT